MARICESGDAPSPPVAEDSLTFTSQAAPILTPVVLAQGFDGVWWALLLMVVLLSAFLTPPFGFAIFYLKSVTPKAITIEHIYRATAPFIVLQLLFVLLAIRFPRLLTRPPDLIK